MARLTLFLIVLLSIAFVVVSGGNSTNTTTPATPKAPNPKPPSVPGAGVVTKLVEAAEEIPKAIVNTCVDTIEAVGSLFGNPFG